MTICPDCLKDGVAVSLKLVASGTRYCPRCVTFWPITDKDDSPIPARKARAKL